MANKKIQKKIIKATDKRFNHIQSSYQLYVNNPYVSDYVHRLRVDMRKLRALLNFIKPIIENNLYKEMNYTLRDLGKKLSPIRDLDTLIEECTFLAEKQPELVENYAAVFKFLEKERLKLVQSKSTKEIFKEFNEALEQAEKLLETLDAQLDKMEPEKIETFFENRFEAKTTKVKKQYGKLDITDYEEIHEVRKQAKKVRYASAGYKKILPKKERKKIQKEAKSIQRELGELTDSHVIIELLELYKEKTNSKKVKVAFQELIKYYKTKSHDKRSC